MMDQKSQAEFDRIVAIPDLKALSKDEIRFLTARRAYLNPSQRLGYSELNLFPKAERVSGETEKGKKNINDLTVAELAELEVDADESVKDKK